MTQISEMIRKRSGGEGGIVRGYAANPPLRSGPTRARRPKSLRDFVEPTEGTLEIKSLLENP